jgi:outer membrane protein assembly factor BamD (BamD/ComL family)
MLNYRTGTTLYRTIPQLILIALAFFSGLSTLCAQPGTEIEVAKPKKYENRKLGAEKTPDKKISFPKKVYQNTVTHYNYYFNANQRLNDLVTTAKTSFKEDYSQLLPFYNYSLDATSQNKEELDSIIYKCTAGILLHDLRNSWIDNMYLLLGKAYFYRKDLDSAGLTFQYLNFSYAPKENGGYDIPIGSNASNDKGEFSIATKEKNSIWKKLTSRPPSRNESFIWQIRNYIERDELPEAAGIIEILRNDPNFPNRLQTDLDEVVAYWFYRQQAYDSAAHHLSLSLSKAENVQEKARWEYLIAQMYQLANKNEDAVKFYDKSIEHTTDPILDVYARLNSIRIRKSGSKDYLQENIDELLRMAKKEKYSGYRDIIYYAAANIELERKNYDGAQANLLKSVEFTTNNPLQRSQSFLLLGDMNYDRKIFPDAYNFYDSLEVNVLPKPADKERVTLRKPPLQVIAENAGIIRKQDSLQLLARLTPQQRDSAIKRQMKILKKGKGSKEEESAPGFNAAVKQQPDLFATNTKSNDFYFYNASAKARGFSEFKAKWGDRPNVDNWRRKAAVDKQTQQRFTDVDDVPTNSNAVEAGSVPDDSYEGMQANIPLSQVKLDSSNKNIMDALFIMGKTFLSKLEEYPSAIQAFEELLRRFPASMYKDETMFNLVYAYQKTGDKAKSDYYKNMLAGSGGDSKWVELIKNPPAITKNEAVIPATKKYEEIYNMFIEGRFAEAIAEKKVADSLYDKSNWSPQLLFIESIYYIKQQDDSTAIKSLTDLSTLYPDNAMAARAKTMIDVLKRRKEIESYLTNLEVTRREDGTAAVATPAPVHPAYNNNTNSATQPVVKTDSAVASTNKPQDTKTGAVVKQDSVASTAVPPTVAIKNFNFVSTEAHFVGVILDKVDPVYQSEARNAFNRYNKEKFYNQKIDISSTQIDERFNLLLQGPFTDANTAVDYIDKIKPIVKSRILPWLSADKYTFFIISQGNLDTLKTSKDMEGYKQLLQTALPGKF